MKSYLSIILVVVSILLAAALAVIKHGDNAQLDTATGAINDYSNQLSTAQLLIGRRDDSLMALSNTLAESTSATLAISNQLAAAQSTNTAQAGQITSLNQQLAAAAAEKQTLNRNLMDLTGQMAALKEKITLAEASLDRTNQVLVQANKDYARLENRFLRDVAERTVVERRFNNLAEVQAQEQKLQKVGAPWVTPESIYAGLDVEVKSNGTAHVISPD